MRHLELVTVILLSLWLPAGCGDGKNAVPVSPGVPVLTARVIKKLVPIQINAIGVVEASQAVAIASQAGGILQKAHFTEGQEVKEGDLLFTIDPAPYQAQVRQAEANLARARAEANNAQSTLQRYEGLVGKEYITKESYDQAKAAALGTQASARAAEAALENARLQLGYTAIRAPITGRTGDLLVKEGSVIKANDPGVPLVRLNKLKPALVRFSVPEQRLSEIREENSRAPLPVVARVQGLSARSEGGRLFFIDNAVDRSTGTILLKGLFENAGELLWPGQFVEISLTLRQVPEALVVPGEALQSGQRGPYVWVVESGHAEIRNVETAFSVAGDTIITSGLSAGEEIVTDGQLRLSAGSKVLIKNSAGTEGAAK